MSFADSEASTQNGYPAVISATQPDYAHQGMIWVDTSGGAGNETVKVYDNATWIIMQGSGGSASTLPPGSTASDVLAWDTASTSWKPISLPRIDYSSGAADAGKLVLTDNTGTLDKSLYSVAMSDLTNVDSSSLVTNSVLVFNTASSKWEAKPFVTTGGIQAKGLLDPTTAAPSGLTNGDVYYASKAGVIDASFAGIAGSSAGKGDMFMYASGAWHVLAAETDLSTFLPLSGSTPMTGELILSGDATKLLGAIPKQQLDAAITALVKIPAGTVDGQILSWDSATTSWKAAVRPKELPAGTITGQTLVWNSTSSKWELQAQLAFANITTGTPDAGKIVKLNATGKIDATMLPTLPAAVKGAIDVTKAMPANWPSVSGPKAGDIVFATTGGVLDTSWTHDTNPSVNPKDMVIFDGTYWSVIPASINLSDMLTDKASGSGTVAGGVLTAGTLNNMTLARTAAGKYTVTVSTGAVGDTLDVKVDSPYAAYVQVTGTTATTHLIEVYNESLAVRPLADPTNIAVTVIGA